MFNGTNTQRTLCRTQLASDFGFNIDQVYNLAQVFFSEKSDKAFHLTFDDRIRLSALNLQIKHGKIEKSKTASPGILDFVGRKRIAEWEALGDMDSEEAKWEFVKRISELCPLFLPYLEAYSRNSRLTSTEKASNSDVMESGKDSPSTKSITHQEFIIHNEAEIRAALNSQTKEQFETYALQQYPSDPAKRTELIAHLQDRHFHEYVDYIQHHYDWQQQPQSDLESQDHIPLDPHVDVHPNTNTQTTAVQTTVRVEHNLNGLPHKEQAINDVQSPSCPTIVQASVLQPVHHAASSEDLLLSRNSVIPVSHNTIPQDPVMQANPTINPSSDAVDHGDNNKASSSVAQSAAVVRAPSMWTRGEIQEFKASLVDIKDAVVQVGCGEVITVRVPAYPSGTSIVWEFATDDYDIGFGLFFEWSSTLELPSASPCEAVDPDSSKIAGSEEATLSSAPVNVDTNPNPLVDEIIPVYRRNSHQEVYCGSHIYPGLGTYLFKFDNSYSLWRSKTLYYRVYYTC